MQPLQNPPFCELIKKKIKFSLYIRIFRWDRLQSQIWLTASTYMDKYLHSSSFSSKPFPIYDFATDPIWISLYVYEENFVFFFISAVFVGNQYLLFSILYLVTRYFSKKAFGAISNVIMVARWARMESMVCRGCCLVILRYFCSGRTIEGKMVCAASYESMGTLGPARTRTEIEPLGSRKI